MKKGEQPNPWRHVHMGLEFAGAAALTTIIGYVVDRQYGTYPWGVLIGATIGFVGGFYLFIKEALLANKESMAGMGGLTGKPSLYQKGEEDASADDAAEAENRKPHSQTLGRAAADEEKGSRGQQGGGSKEAGGEEASADQANDARASEAGSEYDAKLAEWMKLEQQADELAQEGEEDESGGQGDGGVGRDGGSG